MQNVSDIGAMEFEKLAAFAQRKRDGSYIVGMDDPLVGGVVDVFEATGCVYSDLAKMQQSWKAPRHFPRI